MKGFLQLWLFCLICYCCSGHAVAGESLINLEKLGGIVNINSQIVDLLIIPAIVWTVGFVKDQISEFLKNRNYNRTLKVYQAALAAVDWVYVNSVKSLKAKEQKLTESVATAAMDSAMRKLQEIAEKDNIASLLPQNPVDIKLLLEQAIADRKNGTLTTTFLNTR